MHIEVNRADLARVLAAVGRIVETRNTYPILANVLLTATADKLTVRGTDLDIEITMSVPATCTSGVTTLPARQLLDIVKRLVGDTVKMELKGETMTVKSGRSVFRLSTLDPKNFPSLAAGVFSHSFKIDLAGALKPVVFAIESNPARYYLCGIYMHDNGGELRVVATDGNCLGRLTLPLPDGAKGMPGIIVPAKAISVFSGMVGEVDVDVSENKIRATSGDMIVLSKLIEGVYPDYERVTPKGNDKVATMDRSALVDAVARVSTIAGKAVKMSFAADSLRLEVTSQDHGTSSDELEAKYAAEPFDIGFQPRFLNGVIGSIEGDTVTFTMGGDAEPVLVTGDDPRMLSILMPYRV